MVRRARKARILKDVDMEANQRKASMLTVASKRAERTKAMARRARRVKTSKEVNAEPIQGKAKVVLQSTKKQLQNASAATAEMHQPPAR